MSTSKYPFYWVDAFASQAFGGNPAGVMPLQQWLPDAQMQRMAWQHGLSETAFFVKTGENRFHLRWFTPATEVDLCGHATLASAHVLFNEMLVRGDQVTFETKSGPLPVTRGEDKRLILDFPSRPATAADCPPALATALGGTPAWTGLTQTSWFCVFATGREVRALQPDHPALKQFKPGRIIVTGPGDEPGVDFVSRYFAPDAGVTEDPVTGSAHTTLTPYWAEKLGKLSLRAKQVSPRGGELWCTLNGDRVSIAGQAATYLRGQIDC